MMTHEIVNDRRSMADSRSLWSALGRQLHHPEGPFGEIVGRLMVLVNGGSNRAALEALQVGPSDKVLELGFGPGQALKALSQQARLGIVCGIDQSDRMMILAGRRNRKAIERGQLKLIKGGFHSLPFPTATFDKMHAVNVAYFFGEDGREMAEIHRVLKPGGRLVLYVTARSTMEAWPFARSGGHRLYTSVELRSSIEWAGFAPAHVKIEHLRLPFGVEGILGTASGFDRLQLRYALAERPRAV